MVLVVIIKKKIIAVRSHYPDIRLEKEMAALSIKYDITIIGWNRGRLILSKSNQRPNRIIFSLNAAPGSIKVPFVLPYWWMFDIIQLLFNDFDIIHAVDFDSYLPSLIIAKLKRKPIIYDIYDFYGETIDFPLFKKFCRKFFTKIDKFLMKYADSIIIVDDARIEQIGNSHRRIISVYNSPIVENESLSNHKRTKQDDFIVFFGGILLEDRGVDHVITAVKALNDETVKLILMGYPGTLEYGEKIKELCRDTKNIQLQLEMVPHEQILEYTSKADTIFILYDPKIPNNVFASPNKLFESMCFSKPVIVSDGSSMTKIVKDSNCGVIVQYGNIEEIKQAILKLKDNPLLCNTFGENGRKAYEQKYSWTIMEKRLVIAYENLRN